MLIDRIMTSETGQLSRETETRSVQEQRTMIQAFDLFALLVRIMYLRLPR